MNNVDIKHKYLSFELRKLSVEREDILSCRFDGSEFRFTKDAAVNHGAKIEGNQLNKQNGVGPRSQKLPGAAAVAPSFPAVEYDNIISKLTSKQPIGISSSSFSPTATGQFHRINQSMPKQLNVDSGNSELNGSSDMTKKRAKEYYSAAFRELALSVVSSYDQDSISSTPGRGGLDQLQLSFQEFCKLPTLSSTVSSVGGTPSNATNTLSQLPTEGTDLS